MNTQLTAILNTKVPTAKNYNLRQFTRKEWSVEVRNLLKSLKIKGVSVTTPNYSQAATISIRLPDVFEEDTFSNHNAHQKSHYKIDQAGGNTTDCPHCAQRWSARKHLETIILSAFPDLNDRSTLREDYYDYCLSFE